MRFYRNLAILAKNEATYGVDAVPTGAANAMLMVNARLEPLVGQDLSRDLLLPYMGQQGIILDGNYARLTGEIEIAGAGAAGTAPAYGPMLRACAMQEVIDAGVDVQYKPVSKLQEAATIYFNADGVRHVLLGSRGSFTLNLTPLQIPRFTFTMTGLLGTITDTALPAVTLNAWQTPVAVNKANTTFSLHGLAGACEGVTMDIGNQIEPRFLIGSESIEHVDRQMTGSAIMEAVSLATKNWFQIALASTKGVLAAAHGTVAGNIVEFDAPAVQIGRPTLGETQRILNNTLPLFYTPTAAGNDEFTITVK
ncbi:phage tail tube protein [Ensifer aridi]|uniref:phage tail tube protein n=1 Tax=Ensifer aridi TaxID=1708715 RepID=UPI000A11C276|nr:phage tail tube protein [Ensifer aridi]